MVTLKYGFICMFLGIAAVSYSQNEIKKDTIHLPEKGKITTIQSKPLSDIPALTTKQIEQASSNYNLTNPFSSASYQNPTFKVSSSDYFPKQLSEAPSTSHIPHINDYSYSGIKPLSAVSWLSGSTEHTTLPTFGTIQQTSLQYNRMFGSQFVVSGGFAGQKLEMHEQQYGDLKANLGMKWLVNRKMNVELSGNYSILRSDGGMGSRMGAFIPSEISNGRTSGLMPIGNAQLGVNYQMTNWLTISGGTYFNRNNLFQRNFSDYGVNSRVNLQVNDRIKIKLHGSYSLKGNQLVNNNPFYPENNYGGAVEFKISDKFGVGAGVDRTLNPFTGKWETHPYFYPIFYNDNN